jgi:hypothetical protein
MMDPKREEQIMKRAAVILGVAGAMLVAPTVAAGGNVTAQASPQRIGTQVHSKQVHTKQVHTKQVHTKQVHTKQVATLQRVSAAISTQRLAPLRVKYR